MACSAMGAPVSDGGPRTPSFSAFGSQTFTMDAQTGSYTFGYDTGPWRELLKLLDKLKSLMVHYHLFHLFTV